MRWSFLVLLAALSWLTPAQAHESRPAILKATEITEGVFDIVWTEPVVSGLTPDLAPIFPDVCGSSEPVSQLAAGARITRFQVDCSLRSGWFEIGGLTRTLIDVVVQIKYLDGEQSSALLRPGRTGFDLSARANLSVFEYFAIGIEHIWFGPDHLLFVFGLVLLVPYRRLFVVITAFTVSHSLTLGAAALDFVTVPGRPVEILIAMSIALLAVEVVQKLNGAPPSLARRYPWIISFVIGLIHGLGFAGALADIGLPKGAEIGALALFNIGVEAGQIAFVIALLLVFWGLNKVIETRMALLARVGAYFIGAVGMFWTIERVFAY